MACGGRAAVIGLRWPGGCDWPAVAGRVSRGLRWPARARGLCGLRWPAAGGCATIYKATIYKATGGRPADDGACLPRCPGRTAAHVDIQGDGHGDTTRTTDVLPHFLFVYITSATFSENTHDTRASMSETQIRTECVCFCIVIPNISPSIAKTCDDTTHAVSATLQQQTMQGNR